MEQTKESNLAILHLKRDKNVDHLSTTFESPASFTICQLMLLHGDGETEEYNIKPLKLTSMDASLCSKSTQLGTTPLHENMFCASSELLAGTGVRCQEGVGSPLVCNDQLAGILAASSPSGHIGMYNDVSKFNNWIDDVFKTTPQLEAKEAAPPPLPPSIMSSSSDTITPIPTIPDEVKTFCTPDNRNCMQEWRFMHREGYEISSHRCINQDQVYTCLYVKKQTVAIDPQELRIYNTHNHYYFKNMSPAALKFILPVPNIDQVLNKLDKN